MQPPLAKQKIRITQSTIQNSELCREKLNFPLPEKWESSKEALKVIKNQKRQKNEHFRKNTG
jgi:hypothetical protein